MSVTRTLGAIGTAVPTIADWLLPALSDRRAAGPAIVAAVNCVVRPSAVAVSVLLATVASVRHWVVARPSAPVVTVDGVAVPEPEGVNVTLTFAAGPLALLTMTETGTSAPATMPTKVAGMPAAGATPVVAGGVVTSSSEHDARVAARASTRHDWKRRTSR
ncbi:MAG: hypothetical protein IPF98_01475 [Gemmatimonadetes bacterium]|nr:hypothetical protein [Gemmatimonadota bacterium]